MKKYQFSPEVYKTELTIILNQILDLIDTDEFRKITQKNRIKFNQKIERILKNNPKDKSELFSRDQLIQGIEMLEKEVKDNTSFQKLKGFIKMKPTRTISGVTTVTVFTKPWMCPGKCVFCPNDVRMPKSYIATEPGAQRALANKFSPYLQTFNRLKALKNIGHPTEKIELLILGGSWSSYPEKYQVWFIKECFRAMQEFEISSDVDDKQDTLSALEMKEYLSKDYNEKLRDEIGDDSYNKLVRTKEFKEGFENKYVALETYDRKTSVDDLWKELEDLHKTNAIRKIRCVGLVLETRPDLITEKEVYRMRRLGATKVQLGIQVLDDNISDLNKRGEHKVHTANAFALLRKAGFKIHAHMMPNLYGARPEIDLKSWHELYESENYKPDEVKIYPTSIIKNTELSDLYEEGKYEPYDNETLIKLISEMMETAPEYTRITRVIRDIPSTEIEAGNKTTNLRQVVEYKLKKESRANPNIRAREIKGKKVTFDDLELDIIKFSTTVSTEYFLQYITKEREIAGFLRLSVPRKDRGDSPHLTSPQGEGQSMRSVSYELKDSAIIREVHVYGPSLELSKGSKGEAQHLGLGSKLIEKSKEIAKENGFSKLAVISAIGTREYYDKRGFKLQSLYQIADLS
ncbi:MAG: tRNA uridine(34) 5-carboxymethylaminomethyl modification radical SAM/GNAT enzyme Elp3 [Candidatus Dojkabacteria bacterium]|nr:tRNA uridine(34) 5-carboxymethylaminomethyl modification radical SAM/GNAT enzyme Elp3 [Candidatus Dojkabacteria bacterium]